jgi:hypothetical protein
MGVTWRPRLRRALVAGVLAVFAATALVSVVQASRGGSGPAAVGQYEKKVTICHRTRSKKNPFVTIRVSRNAVPAHLRHGDKLGPCQTQSFAMCHKTKTGKKQTIKVKFRALRAHLRKGDKLGACKKKKAKSTKSKAAKGKSGNKGKGQGPKPPKKG